MFLVFWVLCFVSLDNQKISIPLPIERKTEQEKKINMPSKNLKACILSKG